MGSTDHSRRSPNLTPWMLALALGAVVGVAAAAALLGRRSKAEAEESDAPLFI